MFGIIQALQPRHWRELYRHFRNFNYEVDDENNLLISHAKISGVYEIEAPDGLGVQRVANLLTTEGCNHLLSVGVAGGSQVGTWYIAPFSGNVTVADTWTAATFAATATEITTSYSESTRVAFVESTPASKSTNNSSNPAVFTSNTTNVLIWGIGLLSSSTKGSTSGTLLSAAKYSTVRSLPASGDQLSVAYTLTLANS